MRRNRRLNKINNKPSKNLSKVLVFLTLLILFFIFYVTYKVSTLDKFIVVNKLENSDSEILIIKSNSSGGVIKYLIPNELELDTARNFGEYQLGNVWTLGDKEGYGGSLVVETLSKNYYLPVSLWKDGNKSNLNFFQLIKFWLASKKDIDYSSSFELKKLPASVTINFVNGFMMENSVTVSIQDLSGEANLSQSVTEILETMGGKVASNSKGYDENLDCLVTGRDIYLTKLISDQFGCERKIDKSLPVWVDIKLGVHFGDRF